jgi:hypothetical protein
MMLRRWEPDNLESADSDKLCVVSLAVEKIFQIWVVDAT